jgi:hypothetical protein
LPLGAEVWEFWDGWDWDPPNVEREMRPEESIDWVMSNNSLPKRTLRVPSDQRMTRAFDSRF